MNNRQLIDVFKKTHDLQLDRDLTSIFGVSKQQLSDWATEKRSIPMPVKFRMLQLIDFPHTAEFAPLFVNPGEHAAQVLRDRAAIADFKAKER